MGALRVIVLDPSVEISLQVLQCAIDLLAKHHAIELVQHRLVEPFANPIGLGMPRFRSGVIDVLHG